MKKQLIGVNFALKFENIEDINPSFAKARIGIAYAGRNRNKSCIKKNVFEEAVPSLFYCPVVGRYDPDKDDFGGHDIRVVHNSDGDLEITNATVPFGVVFADNGVAWEEVVEADGTKREYLFCNVILWKRQYGYERLASQDTWNQSMEIHVDQYVIDSDGYCDIEKMYFEALCILGNDVEPCFESASVQLASEAAVTSYRLQFSAMLDELREIPEFKDMKFNFEGGKNELNFTEEVRDQILAEFGLTLDQLDFEITEEMTEEQFRSAIEAMKTDSEETFENDDSSAGESETEASGSGEHEDGDPAGSEEFTASFAATYHQKYEAIQNALDPVVVYDGSNKIVSETYFWIEDFDDTHVFVERRTWTANDCEVKYGRFQYAFNDADMTASITGDFEEMVMRWLTLEENAKLEQSRNAFEALTTEYEEYKASHSTEDSEVEELRQFRNDRLACDHRDAVDAVLSEFEDLTENEEFVALTAGENAYSFKNADDLREKCFAIRGKAMTPVKFSKKSKNDTIKIGIASEETAPSRYGDLFSRYG